MKIKQVFLHPGEFIVSTDPCRVTTLLGSCVAVCFFHRRLKFGGMNHYLLPTAAYGETSGRYGEYAIRVVLDRIRKEAGGLAGTEAMVFGGASVIKAITSMPNIGDENVALARRLLRKFNIPISFERVGGTLGMKIRFQTWDNKVEYRSIKKFD